MKNVMENIACNLRKAFPRLPLDAFEDQKDVLSLAYLKKCQKYFDFAKMYPAEPLPETMPITSRSLAYGNG